VKPETLAELGRHLRYLDDDALAQFFAVVLNEMNRRGSRLKNMIHAFPKDFLKDCEPIRG